MSTDIRAFQIFYDEETRLSLDRDFEALDNTKSERPDWYEYWAIRNYLLQNELQESTFYGFLSPRFFEKTRLTGAQVKEFVRRSSEADIVTFSPLPCQGACFMNVFEQGEFFHRGLFDLATQFFARVDPRIKLNALVTHSRNTVFANFFLAKPVFWRTWKGVFDQLFELAETPGSPLYARLNLATDHRGKTVTPMKIFVMERAVSFLLVSLEVLRVWNFPPFQIPVAKYMEGRVPEIVMLDALKIALSQTADPDYVRLYMQLRDKVLASARSVEENELAGARA